MNHLEPVPDPPEDDRLDGGWPEETSQLRRPPWWRWVALVLIVSLVIATPFAYALYRLLR